MAHLRSRRGGWRLCSNQKCVVISPSKQTNQASTNKLIVSFRNHDCSTASSNIETKLHTKTQRPTSPSQLENMQGTVMVSCHAVPARNSTFQPTGLPYDLCLPGAIGASGGGNHLLGKNLTDSKDTPRKTRNT